jgi:hypothetical protein
MRGRGSASSDEFIREVDEAVRQDRWLKLWKEYGAFVVGAAVAVVLGTAAGVGWRSWQESQRQAEAESYLAATELLRQNRPAEAAAAFRALAGDADSGYAVLARLQAAHALGQAGDEEGKLAMLRQLADDDAAAPMYRELGGLLALQQQFGAESPDNLTSQLASLTSADNPWRYSALELIALAQMRAGETEAARETLSSLVGDPRTPPDLGRRAAELLSALGGPIGQAGDAQSEMPDQQGQETSDRGEGQ